MDANMQEVVKSSAKREHISGQWTLEQLFSIFNGLTGHVSTIEKRRGRIKVIMSFAFFFAVMGLVGSFVAE